MNTAKQGLNLFMRSKTMSNKSENSNPQNSSTFLYHLEKAVQSILDESLIDFGNDKPLIRSHLKRTVRLIVYTQLERIVKKLVP